MGPVPNQGKTKIFPWTTVRKEWCCAGNFASYRVSPAQSYSTRWYLCLLLRPQRASLWTRRFGREGKCHPCQAVFLSGLHIIRKRCFFLVPRDLSRCKLHKKKIIRFLKRKKKKAIKQYHFLVQLIAVFQILKHLHQNPFPTSCRNFRRPCIEMQPLQAAHRDGPSATLGICWAFTVLFCSPTCLNVSAGVVSLASVVVGGLWEELHRWLDCDDTCGVTTGMHCGGKISMLKNRLQPRSLVQWSGLPLRKK